MKRFLCVALAILLVSASAMAATATFDYSAYEGKETFTYDKFDKTWQFFEYLDGADGQLEMCFAMQGNADGEVDFDSISFFQASDFAERVQILIGDTVYEVDLSKRLEAEGGSMICLTETTMPLFEAIMNADEISVRAYFNGTTREDSFAGLELQGMQGGMRIMMEQDVLNCYSEFGLQYISMAEEGHWQDIIVR